MNYKGITVGTNCRSLKVNTELIMRALRSLFILSVEIRIPSPLLCTKLTTLSIMGGENDLDFGQRPRTRGHPKGIGIFHY